MTDDHHHPTELAPVEARVAAIESVLVEKGILDIDALDQIVQHFEDNLGPMNGAKVVARADARAAAEVVQGTGLPVTRRA